jgi:DNA-binding CsgD family transcriptional regulator
MAEELIGRARELGVVLGALDPEQAGARAVLLEGEAGVGKTVLWRRAVEAAAERGWLTVIAAPAASEARLAFAALGDLFDVAVDEALVALPEPQREALEIALLRRDGDLGAPELGGRMIGVATLGALRALAADQPLVVAIDDMQWMDSSSAAALRFALRRLRSERVAVLATRRLDHLVPRVPELERILGDDRVTRIRLGPLSVAGLHELLRVRLGASVSRPMLLRLHEAAGGNPFFGLEIGRELLARGAEPAPGEPLPVPGNVRELLQARLERLAAGTREVLLAAAAMARPTPTLLGRLSESAERAVDEAIAAGVLELVGERVRFTHPLLASVLYDQAPLVARRRVHGRLAEIVETLAERARHLALASSGVDERVASQLDSVACEAARRGAPLEAAELADLATRLTPAEGDREHRMLAAAEYHHRAGALKLAADRASEALDHLANPTARARALCLLGTIAADAEGFGPAVPLYRRALRESGVLREQRADVHQKLAWTQITAGDARLGERHARAMVRLLSHAGDAEDQAAAAGTLSLAIAARGRAVPDALLDRVLEVEAPASPAQSWAWSVTGPAMLEGVVLLWSGELERARGPLERMLRVATECQDPWLEMHALAYLSSLETYLGQPLVGLELAERYLELAVASEQDAQRAGALWPVAVAAAWVGRADMARRAAHEGLEIVERTGHRLYEIGNLTALGGLELALDRPAAAVDALERAWEIAHRGRIESQARFPILADAVQALAAIGELAHAGALAAELDRIAYTLDRPWIAALAARCRGLVAAGSGDHDAALREFDAALEQHAQQERPLDRARTLLAGGQVNRRARRKSAARAQLEQAAQLFDDAGAELWSERTRVELGRIGGRRPAPSGRLSTTESAIAELVADGRTNREVAAALHLTEKTVEWNLSKIYRKLGVRSRTELSRTWATAAFAAAEEPAS